ncbi:EamA family transporter [Tumebacillus permanentifrigoris]|uniref:Transporter family protein n=1 Tax=Tumebacillus permanentifrigoris TaxID=378543 RepID=A0A316DS97_9BACL|nr:EamA family transporter [Tumebacillus permanentifrigoris]PWK08415.1 transporter family protein [Tumebacillus permanentifrigoris]
MSWLVMALLSAAFASLVAILGKIGMSEVDSNLATAIRAVVMAGASVIFVAFTGSLGQIKTVDFKALLFILFSGLAGAASWMFYFGALRLAPASKVAPIDRLSVVFTLILAALFLKEKISFGIVAGCVLIVAGSILIARA